MTSPLPGFFQGTEMPTAGWWEALWPDPAGVLAAVGLKPGMDVIDLCSGDGWFTRRIAKVARHVVAIDIDPDILQVARQRLVGEGVTNCEFIQGDAYELAELVPRPVDLVFMANCFHGVPDPVRLAQAIRKALKPNGRFAVVNWHRRPREETPVLGEPRGPKTELRLSPQQTIKSVEAGGLNFTQLIEVPPFHYAVVFGLSPVRETAIGSSTKMPTKRRDAMSVESQGEIVVDVDALREEVKNKYREVATDPHGNHHFHTGRYLAKHLGYDDSFVETLPDVAVESFAGVASPFALRSLAKGERVVDVGSGAGFDSFVAAHQVGATGRVIGVDMTEEMLAKSRSTVGKLGLTNVEFREGLAEHLPVEDGWADVVISNGVINLCADKKAVFSEIHRVLRPGGRLQFADIANGKPVPEAAIQNIDLWTA